MTAGTPRKRRASSSHLQEVGTPRKMRLIEGDACAPSTSSGTEGDACAPCTSSISTEGDAGAPSTSSLSSSSCLAMSLTGNGLHDYMDEQWVAMEQFRWESQPRNNEEWAEYNEYLDIASKTRAKNRHH